MCLQDPETQIIIASCPFRGILDKVVSCSLVLSVPWFSNRPNTQVKESTDWPTLPASRTALYICDLPEWEGMGPHQHNK